MNKLLAAFPDTVLAAVILLPAFACLRKTRFHSNKTVFILLVFSLYLCTVYTVAGLPNIVHIRFDPNCNTVPFQYFFSDRSTLLNVILFIPLGVFLPILKRRFRCFLPTFLFGLLMSTIIEFLQIFTLRATDVNDLMTNSAGTVLGYYLWQVINKHYPDISLQEENIKINTLFVFVFLMMFFFHPVLLALLRYMLYL